jgi:hypothetical protein
MNQKPGNEEHNLFNTKIFLTIQFVFNFGLILIDSLYSTSFSELFNQNTFYRHSFSI